MALFDAIARLMQAVMRAWLEGCALHAQAEGGRAPDLDAA